MQRLYIWNLNKPFSPLPSLLPPLPLKSIPTEGMGISITSDKIAGQT